MAFIKSADLPFSAGFIGLLRIVAATSTTFIPTKELAARTKNSKQFGGGTIQIHVIQYTVYECASVCAFSHKIYRIFQFCGLQTKSPFALCPFCCCFSRNSANSPISTRSMYDGCIVPN